MTEHGPQEIGIVIQGPLDEIFTEQVRLYTLKPGLTRIQAMEQLSDRIDHDRRLTIQKRCAEREETSLWCSRNPIVPYRLADCDLRHVLPNGLGEWTMLAVCRHSSSKSRTSETPSAVRSAQANRQQRTQPGCGGRRMS